MSVLTPFCIKTVINFTYTKWMWGPGLQIGSVCGYIFTQLLSLNSWLFTRGGEGNTSNLHICAQQLHKKVLQGKTCLQNCIYTLDFWSIGHPHRKYNRDKTKNRFFRISVPKKYPKSSQSWTKSNHFSRDFLLSTLSSENPKNRILDGPSTIISTEHPLLKTWS